MSMLMDEGAMLSTASRLALAGATLGVALVVVGLRRRWPRSARWGFLLLFLGGAGLAAVYRLSGNLPRSDAALVAALVVIAALLLVPRPRATAELVRTSRPERRLATGRRATRREIRRWMRAPNGPGSARLPWVAAFGEPAGLLRRGRVKGDLIWPVAERAKHILVVGKPGSGKTTEVILPLVHHDCRQPGCSTIVIDTKGDFWRLSEAARRAGKTVWLFKPTDLTATLSWNLLATVSTVQDAQELAATVIHATGGVSTEDPFWDQSAQALLAALIWGLRVRQPERLSMRGVHDLVQRGALRVARWLDGAPETRRLAGAFIGLARGESKNADTIISTLNARIQLWGDPAVGAATAGSEIDIGKLASEAVFFVIEVPEARMRRLQPLVNIALTEIIRRLLLESERGVLPIPVSLVIDEFASAVGRLYDIENKLNSVRSRRISIVAALQSLGQLEPLYGAARDAVLGAFGTQIYLADVEHPDAEYAARKSGQQEVVVEGAQATRAPGDFFDTEGTTRAIQTRQVVTTDDVRNDAGLATVFLPRTRAFQARFRPCFEDRTLARSLQGLRPEGVTLREAPITPVDADREEEALFRAGCPARLAAQWDEYARREPGTARHLRDLAVDLAWDLETLMRTWETLDGQGRPEAENLAEEMRRRAGF